MRRWRWPTRWLRFAPAPSTRKVRSTASASEAGRKVDLEQDRAAMKRVLDQVKQLENQGYQFEAAEASFELLVRKEVGRRRTFFNLDHYRIVVGRQESAKPVSEATVKLRVD